MIEASEIHKEAMELAEQAAVSKLRGETEHAQDLLRQAFEKEKKAASLVAVDFSLEPTRSVLHRSAAWLAFECQEYREAERLVATGLAGNPPEVIAEELRELLDQIHFGRHLQLRGVTLSAEEFQFSISGDAVGHGVAESERFVARVQDLEKLVYRTAERRWDRPYRDRGRRHAGLAREVEVFLTVPRAASFAVSFRLGYGDQMALPGLNTAETVVDELLACLELFNQLQWDGLKRRIPDESYYRNFLALTKRIAPDGEAVRTVGFTVVRHGEEKRVVLTTPRPQVPVTGVEQAEARPEGRMSVRGMLRYADARREGGHEIRLVDNTGAVHRVRVPGGLMDDIVRPLWDYEVIVAGRRQNRVILLEDIERAPEEPG